MPVTSERIGGNFFPTKIVCQLDSAPFPDTGVESGLLFRVNLGGLVLSSKRDA